MNILFLAKDSGLGGIVTSTRALAEGLIKNKNAHVVIGISRGMGQREKLKEFDVRIIDFNSHNPIVFITNYFKISKIIKENKIDIIHAQNRLPALYAHLYSKFHKEVKYIWVNHLVPIPSGWIYRKSTKYGYKAVTDCIEGKTLLERDLRIPKADVMVINLGLDTKKIKRVKLSKQEKIKKQLGINPNEKVIFLYGRLTEHKGHLFLLDCISEFKEKNFKLIFPGENEEYKIRVIEHAKELGLEDRLIFPGFVKGYEILSFSDLLVLPSKRESFGMSLVEAFCLKVPVIRTKTGGYEDMKDMCFGIDYGDEKELSKLLKLFFEEEVRFKKRAEDAYEKVDRFDINNVVEKYYTLYLEALGKK